ncbi:MAG TPA: hypothetical protein VJ276_05150 [Thermoanaerobaculia bacterium]|nr:hypothetical protein [Thermoanaerobaculia bacterium]
MPRSLFAALLLIATALTAQQPQQPPRDPAEGGPTTATKTTPAAPDAAAAPALDTKPLRWRSIGPANMGGRIADFAVVEKDPYTIFVAVGTGGVLRTTNNGTTWEPVFDKEAVASTGSVAVSQNNPKIVWVGTGEGNSRNSSSWGNGVYKSTDGGDSWKNTGLPESHDVPKIALDPKNDDVAYAAVLGHLWGTNPERGVYKTSDGGKTWQQALAIDAQTGAIDVIVDPSDPKTVYAAMWARRRYPWGFTNGGATSGIYKSVDAGKTWKKLTEGLPAETGRIGLDIYRKNPKVLYAVVESDIGGTVDLGTIRSRSGGVFRTDDAGAHWKRVSNLTPRGFYFGKVRVDPTNDQRVYVLGFGTAVSDDGGKTFLNTGARDIHGDCHALWIDPANPNHVLMGTDGGIYFSYDKTKTWDFQNNVALGEFYNVSYGMDTPYTICGGLQDNGTWCGPSRTRRSTADDEDDKKKAVGIWNADWDFVNGGDGFWSAIDPTNANIIYAEYQGGNIVRIDRASGKQRDIKPRPKEGTPEFRFNWNTPFVISHHDPKTLYLGGNMVFRLTNRGDNWEAISPDLTARDVNRILTAGSSAENYGTVVALSESPKDRNTLWAGTDDGNVQVTRDGGKSWTNVTDNIAGAPRGLWVSRVQASNHDAARGYVAIDGHRSDDFHPYLFVTDDDGRTFRAITNGIPAHHPIKGFREDPVNPNLLFAGTEFDVFMTLDRGAHWQSIKGNLPTVAVDDIQIHPREHDLIIGTHGRSIWVIDDISGLEQLTPEKMAQPAALFDPRPAVEYYENPIGGLWGAHIFKAKNPPSGAYINYWLKGNPSEDVSITIEDAKGNKVRELDAGNRGGLNRAVWDLRGDPLEVISESRGEEEQPQYVPAGTYTVKLKYGDYKAETKLVVTAEPGVHEGEFSP